MRRHMVNVCVRVETIAGDAEEAVDYVLRLLESIDDNVESLDTLVVSCDRVPALVPEGAERWARMAREVGFLEWRSGRTQYATADGSWWWHDGCAALRCGDGDAPGEAQDGDALLFPPDRKDRVIEWGDVFERGMPWGAPLVCRRATIDGDIIADERYVRLVEGSFGSGEVTWRAGASPDPIHAIADGRVVAVVMPVRP